VEKGAVGNQPETGGYLPPSKANNYIPPKQKRVSEYTKDDYPSNPTEENQSYHFQNTCNNKEFVSASPNNSFSEYDFQTKDKDMETNKNNLDNVNNINKMQCNAQETIDYNSAYDSNNKYFMSGFDPK
jgi:hypothetical protein